MLMNENSIIPFYQTSGKQIIKAEDCYLYDREGKKYTDFESGVWCANLGHCHKSINLVMEKQIREVIHLGIKFLNSQAEELSASLLDKLGMREGKSAFLSSGSEAVNLAITLAQKITDREKVLKLDTSFLSALGLGAISEGNKSLLNVPFDSAAYFSNIDFKEIAAFVLEPGTSSGAIHFPSSGFIDAITAEVRKNGGLMIVDEVTTGFGRTGKWFGFQHYNLQPDIVAVGKALGNGYPVSAVAVTKKVSDLFDKHYFRYAQSHQNDPLGCAIGNEVLKLLSESGVVEQSQFKGRYFLAQLAQLKGNHSDKIKDVRGRGLMLGLELMPQIDVEKLNSALFDNGAVIGMKEKTLRFMPPLTIERMEIDNVVQMIDKLLKAKN